MKRGIKESFIKIILFFSMLITCFILIPPFAIYIPELPDKLHIFDEFLNQCFSIFENKNFYLKKPFKKLFPFFLLLIKSFIFSQINYENIIT
jgi:hypothetical protein